jgi:hypothetical protein
MQDTPEHLALRLGTILAEFIVKQWMNGWWRRSDDIPIDESLVTGIRPFVSHEESNSRSTKSLRGLQIG